MSVVLQVVHATPFTPQLAVLRTAQAPLLQQLVGQDVPLHWQVAVVGAPTHCWPEPQVPPEPQRHVPCEKPH
ncbi:MAG: hypothetical protein AMXMBFR34_29480 [Myxococcaceae bacterium]